jgi:hypothetical protein
MNSSTLNLDILRGNANRQSKNMALQNTRAFTGIPNFNVIDIDPATVANCLQDYVNRGSKLTGVSLDDIDTSMIKLPDDPSTATLTDLLSGGMQLFDALVWLTAGRPASHPLVMSSVMEEAEIPSLMEVAKAVFYVYFFLMTQARYPAAPGDTNAPKVPNFLKVVMGLDEPQDAYVSRICSFNPTQFDPSWVKHVSFRGLGQETLSRFGLGVAGYRLFGPFGLYEPKPDLPTELREAVQFAQKVARAPPTWEVHPLTRNPEILKSRGNLNKNLGNLILLAFTDTQINEMVTSRILFAKPVREPSYRNYMMWKADDDISGTTRILN